MAKYEGINFYDVYIDKSVIGSFNPPDDPRGYLSKAVSYEGRLYACSIKNKEEPFGYEFLLKPVSDDVVNGARLIPESELSQLEKSVIDSLKKNPKAVSLELDVIFSNEEIKKTEPEFLRRTRGKKTVD